MIRQFDIHPSPSTSSSADAPLVCVLQSHYLEAIDTVMVAPLLRAKGKITATQVAVPVEFEGENYLLTSA